MITVILSQVCVQQLKTGMEFQQGNMNRDVSLHHYGPFRKQKCWTLNDLCSNF